MALASRTSRRHTARHVHNYKALRRAVMLPVSTWQLHGALFQQAQEEQLTMATEGRQV
jgi:hypothetical protein